MTLITGYQKEKNILQVTAYYNNLEELPQSFIDSGYIVQGIPIAENREGYNAELYYNLETKELFYEYVKLPLTDSERITQLQQENEALRESQLSQDELIMTLMLGEI